MDGRLRLKQRLARLFRPSALLRSNPCSSTAASTSTATTTTSSRLSVSTDTMGPAFINRSFSLPGRLHSKNIIHNYEEQEEDQHKKKKKLISNGYGFTSSSSEGGEEETFLALDFYETKRKKKRKEKRRRAPGQGGCAVTKRSRDPYADFCDSIAEMIVEGEIFGEERLERLLRTYLCLNSPHHHPAILRAFADVSEVVFGQ